jgi:hypothetical protein
MTNGGAGIEAIPIAESPNQLQLSINALKDSAF